MVDDTSFYTRAVSDMPTDIIIIAVPGLLLAIGLVSRKKRN